MTQPARRQRGRRARSLQTHSQSMTTYRILTIRDPRTPGFRWWEIEGRNAETGQTWTAAVCDSRDEARDLLRHMEAAVGGAA